MKYHISKMPLDTDNINKSSSATCGLDLICFFFSSFSDVIIYQVAFMWLHRGFWFAESSRGMSIFSNGGLFQ